MAKTINFTYDGRDYTLEFTRNSIKEMERDGFNIRDLSSKPTFTVELMFAGAFKAHHRFVKPDVIDAIYKELTDKEKLIIKLVEMYEETILTLLGENEENAGNVQWEAK